MSLNQKGVFLALSSGMLYGSLGYFGITVINTGFSVANMLFWRFLVASLFMLPLIILNKREFAVNLKDCFVSMLLGLVFYSASALFYFISSLYIGTGFAMVTYFSYPIYVLLINVIFFKTKVNKSLIMSTLLLTIGIVFLMDLTAANKLNFIGVFIGLIAAFAYAIYIIGSKNLSLPADISTFTISIGCTISCFCVTLWEGSFYYPKAIDAWLNIIAISVIATALPILTLLQALKYISSEKASILSITEPLFVILVGILFLGEKISVIQAVGVLITLVGGFIAIINDSFSSPSQIIDINE